MNRAFEKESLAPSKKNPPILGVGLSMISLQRWKLSKVAIYLKCMVFDRS